MAGIASKAAVMPAVRKKQMIILGGFVVIIGVLAVAASMMGGGAPKRPVAAQKETRKTFAVPGEQVSASDVWRTQEGAKVQALQNELAEIRNRMQVAERQEAQNLKKQTDDRNAQANAQANAAANPQVPAGPQAPPPIAAMPGGPMGAVPGQPPGVKPPPGHAQIAGMPPGMPGAMGPNGELPGPAMERVKGITRVEIGGEPAAGTPAGKAAAALMVQKGEKEANPNDLFLPTGSFMRAVMLSGLDAPTGGQVQQNPHPMVFQVTDYATLPNKFRANIKHCHITGNGYGDISSERAYIRLDRLACVFEDGGAIDVGIKGYVAGDDGRAGVRGRLVSKQGAALQNALIAGVTSGIGNALAMSSTTTSTSALGSTTTVNTGEELKVGIGQGVGRALDKLASYYIKLADQMFPVIEVDAGRMVDIVVTQKVSIERK